MSKITSDFYVETTRRVAIINLPWGFGTIYSVAEPLIPERTRAKINMVTNRDETMKQLGQDLPVESISPEGPLFDIRPVVLSIQKSPPKGPPSNAIAVAKTRIANKRLQQMHRDALQLPRGEARTEALAEADAFEAEIKAWEQEVVNQDEEEPDEWTITVTDGWMTPGEGDPDDEDDSFEMQLFRMGQLESEVWDQYHSGVVRDDTRSTNNVGKLTVGHLADVYGMEAPRRKERKSKEDRQAACQCHVQ